MNHLKVAICQINPTVGDVKGNLKKISDAYRSLPKDVDLAVFSECVVSGYPLEDLGSNHGFTQFAYKSALLVIEDLVKEGSAGIIFGCPYSNGDSEKVWNSAFLVQKDHSGRGTDVLIRKKYNLPNYGVFDEKRVFTSGELSEVHTFLFKGVRIGLQICEETWFPNVSERMKDAELIISINGSPYEVEKLEARFKVCRDRVKQLNVPLIYDAQVGGNDNLVFDGRSFVMERDGSVTHILNSMVEGVKIVDFTKESDQWSPARTPDSDQETTKILATNDLETIYSALVLGLRDYVNKSGFPGVLLGVSGGVDSALVAALSADAFGSDKVIGIRLPSKYSSDHSLKDAEDLCKAIGIRMETVPIQPAVDAMQMGAGSIIEKDFKDMDGVWLENLQARVRGTILMALSNKYRFMLLSTGNKSECSVGYFTLFGDSNGGFNPISDVWKTRVFALSRWRNENIPSISVNPRKNIIPENILTKAPSAELAPNQKDSDSLPEYSVLDPILINLVEKNLSVQDVANLGFDPKVVHKVNDLLIGAEFKRRQTCPGVKITRKIFGRDRRYPIIMKWKE